MSTHLAATHTVIQQGRYFTKYFKAIPCFHSEIKLYSADKATKRNVSHADYYLSQGFPLGILDVGPKLIWMVELMGGLTFYW